MFVLTRPPLSHAHRPCQDLDLFECFSGKSRLSAAFGQAPRCWDWVVCSVPLDQNNMLCWFLIRSQWPCCVTTSVMWTKTFITVLCQKRLLGHNFIIINLAEENFDVVNGPQQDLSTPTGFLLALKQTLRLKPGSLLFGGVPCSSMPGYVYNPFLIPRYGRPQWDYWRFPIAMQYP